MDKIILLVALLSTLGLSVRANDQLHCFVCNNCPNVWELDSNAIENCEDVLNPDQPDITTLDPESTTVLETEPTETIDTTVNTDDTTITDSVTTDSTTTDSVTTDSTTTDSVTTDSTTTDSVTTDSTTTDSVTTETTDSTGTITAPDVPLTTTPQAPGPPPGSYDKALIRAQVGSHQCFIVYRQVGDTIQMNRGCVAAGNNDDETCATANLGQAPHDCRLCSYNQCNIASKYVISIFVVLSSLIVVLVT